MKILALDTSTARVSVALVHNDKVLNELHGGELDGAQFHGELLISLIKQCLNGDRPDVIAVGCGPGPYTGLRVGIATAEVLASAWQLEIVGVSSLEALAHGYRRRGGGDCITVIDIKRKEIAWQSYDADSEPLNSAKALSIDALDQLPKLPLVGPAFVTQKSVQPTVDDDSPVSAVDIAFLAMQKIGSGLDIASHPIYLREPDATASAPRKLVTND